MPIIIPIAGDKNIGRCESYWMSALGRKQTYAVQNGMSALPPVATRKADPRLVATL